MYPSHYMAINEKSPYPIKRRVKGRRSDGGNEPAITLLPPDPYTVLGSPELSWLSSPRVYRTVAPKSAKNREASSFVILGDTLHSPVQSRPASPSGRVSPFRGHGFKSPSTTRPNSRPATPASSPKKGILHRRTSIKPDRTSVETRKDFNRYIGLPPKSPIGGKKTLLMEMEKQCMEEASENHPATCNVTAEESFQGDQTGGDIPIEEKYEISQSVGPTPHQTPKRQINSETKEGCCSLSEKLDVIAQAIEEEKALNQEAEKLMPQEFYRNEFSNRSCPTTPTSKTKSKPDKKDSSYQQREKTPRITSKPPVPPRKIGLKMSLKTNDDSRNKSGRGTVRVKASVLDKDRLPSNNIISAARGTQKTQQNNIAKRVLDKREATARKTRMGTEPVATAHPTDKALNGLKKTAEILQPEATKPEVVDKDSKKFDTSEKLVPCYQPDKCHIAPPTMASPSSIITPSISTPPTSADLAFSSTKNSQSISAAPTTVTSCSLSSVSSTIVLSENLARKENAKFKPPTLHGNDALEKKLDSLEANGSVLSTENKASIDMVRPGNKDLNKEKLTGEIASATGVIKAKPDMEVLSPNNLRNFPPRMPPANVAWEDQRMPNGDISARAPTQGKFRRFISAICKLLSCIFCCRCFMSPCCRGNDPASATSSGRKCCSCCGSLFKCLNCKCNKSKCCEGSRCCRGKKKAKVKSTPMNKSRGKCCAKPICNCCTNCCDRVKDSCLVFREKINSFCKCLFCLNLICCQNLLKKCKCCHKFKCCQSNGCCSCFNPYAKSDPKKLIKKGSRASTNSRENDQLDPVLVEHTSRMKAAIPVLPTCLSVFCLICNIFVPGVGTIISGLLCLCFGKPRFSTKDSPKNRFKSFIINIIIGVAQAFTVVFCLVGWGWSVWWGIIMYKLSRRQKRIKLAEKTQKEAGSSNANQNHVDVEQG